VAFVAVATPGCFPKPRVFDFGGECFHVPLSKHSFKKFLIALKFYDHGDPKLKQQYFANHKGPITFVEEIDTGPVKRRKNGNRLGPWHTIGLQTLAIAKGQTGTMEAVQEKIEYLKAKMIGDIAELREKKPDIKIPKIIWRYALRDGKFRTY
jgi:hypothetical protein